MSRYEIGERIASGGNASVWAGRDRRLDRPVAVKRLHPHLRDDAKARRRFAQEAAAASRVRHPNVVTVLDAGDDADGPFLVMELVRGGTLREALVSDGPFDAGRTVAVATQLAGALAAAHRAGVTHRDIKPENIMLDEGGRVVLTDFGIASSGQHDDRVTTEGAVVGTVDYMAPERAIGQPGGPPADVYSLGLVVYEMLTGRTPFRGGNPVAVALAHMSEPPPPPSRYADVPPALEALVLRALAKEPARRYPSAQEFLAALQAVTGPAAATTAELPALRRSWRRARRFAHRVTRERTSRAAAATYAVLGSMSTYVALLLVG